MTKTGVDIGFLSGQSAPILVIQFRNTFQTVIIPVHLRKNRFSYCVLPFVSAYRYRVVNFKEKPKEKIIEICLLCLGQQYNDKWKLIEDKQTDITKESKKEIRCGNT